MKMTQPSIATNGRRGKNILNPLSTMKSRKQKNRCQSRESTKKIILLNSVKKDGRDGEEIIRELHENSLRNSLEILLITVKRRNLKRTSSLLSPHQQPNTSSTASQKPHIHPTPHSKLQSKLT
jgi:hypothetical protein